MGPSSSLSATSSPIWRLFLAQCLDRARSLENGGLFFLARCEPSPSLNKPLPPHHVPQIHQLLLLGTRLQWYVKPFIKFLLFLPALLSPLLSPPFHAVSPPALLFGRLS
ncbi:hypothetical protein K474DRAFT_1713901 [Panus rudis PR-1116 ss-1]|nr:hypothetical protein K474DRAFT_1713901 [Panus rudis PR-1116 ss-1]